MKCRFFMGFLILAADAYLVNKQLPATNDFRDDWE
jgi:hypothetical protein